MTSNQSNKYSMYTATLELLKDNAGKTAMTPAFAASFARLDSLVTQVLDKDKERMGKTPGKVAAKDEAEDALVTATMIVASAVAAFARSKGDIQLKEKAHVSEGYLRHARSNEQINIAKLTYDLAKSNEEGLAAFAITPTMLEDLKSRIAAYDAALKDVASGVAERMGARTAVSELFIQVDEVLKEEIDPMMQLFRVTDPEFYNQYRAVRVIKDIGVRHAKAVQTAGAVPVPG
jgi:hypothetical protein